MSPKDLRAEVIQLCHYVEDVHSARGHQDLIDWNTVYQKAQRILALIKKEETENG
jgi:hypothetical protein